MGKSHVISDSLFNEAQAEFAIGRNWIAYNTKTYFLDNADMWFFRDKDEAIEFANDNISDVDSYAVIYANSMISLMRQLPYGQDIHFNLTEPGKTILKILENNGHTHTITNHEYLNKGHYRKRIRTKKLNSGIHSVTLIASKVSETEKMMVGVTDDTK